MGKRRSSRELAIKFLYQVELNAGNLEAQLKQFWGRNPCQSDIQEYMESLVHSIFEHQKEVDAALESASEHWPLARMSVIDRNLLRMAASEIMFGASVPPKVAIDEAVEISKKYGSEESPNFVNGVLDRLKQGLDSNKAHSITPPSG